MRKVSGRGLLKKGEAPRILLYAHNGSSFGHIARIGNLAGYIKDELPQASVACISGSRYGATFTPEGVDYIKLPGYNQIEIRGNMVNLPVLDMPWADFLLLRRSMLQSVRDWYRPHIFLADTAPEGSFSELTDILSQRRGCRNILIFPGVLDEREKVLRSMHEQGMLRYIRRYYDHVFSFMDRKVFDMEAEYNLGTLADRTVHCGYILRRYRGRIPPRGPVGRVKRVMVGVGGRGNVTFALLKAIIASHSLLGLNAVYRVYTGAYISPGHFRRLRALAPRGVTVERFTDDVIGEMMRSDLYVGAGGYNQLAEVVYSRVPSLIVPWQNFEEEQLIHTQRLHAVGAVTAYLAKEEATPRALAAGIVGVLRDATRPGRTGIDLDGGRQAARHIRRLLERGRP